MVTNSPLSGDGFLMAKWNHNATPTAAGCTHVSSKYVKSLKLVKFSWMMFLAGDFSFHAKLQDVKRHDPPGGCVL